MSLQDLRQSQSPEKVPTCIVAQCFPQDTTISAKIITEMRGTDFIVFRMIKTVMTAI